MSAPQVPKKARPFVAIAKQHGATIEHGKKHLKVYDGDVLVVVLHRGGHSGYEGRGDMHNVRRAFRARGWM